MSAATPNKPPPPSQKPTGGLLSFRNLTMIAITTTLTLTSLIPLSDLAFVIFSFIYILILAKYYFKSNNETLNPPIFDKNNKILPIYVSIGALIGVYFPILYISEAFFRGDNDRARSASPHLFLLASQIFMEGVVFRGGFSIPIRVFVPVFYNSKRIFAIVDWLRVEFGENGGESWRLYAGRVLAIGNLGFWCFNLFGFLLPIYLPKAFKRYYSMVKD